MSLEENYKYWIENAPKDVVEIIEGYSEEQKEFAFSNELSFGTAGIRGIMGYGTGYLNEFLMAKYSLAYGRALLHRYGTVAQKEGIIIAHDNRRNNILFSETAAKVISALGIPVFLYKGNKLQPTPLLSFTIAKGNYVGGMNITASHNPAEYSGFKVYDHTGTQMLPKDTDVIIRYSKEDVDIFNIKQSDENVHELTSSIVGQYMDNILNLIPFDPIEDKKDIKVIFTAQHGTAGYIATKLMDRMSIDYELVKEQMTPDPEFSNTPSPNPQNPDSFIMARELGTKVDADVLFSTDPDADRFGIEVKHKGKWVHIDGNQLPLIQINYKLMRLKEIDYIHSTDFIVKSVVTSKAAEILAAKYGIKCYDSLTGFKWIINESFKHEMQGNECLFAWEESYGSTVRSFTRDKDSFQALVQVIEIVDYYKKQGKTLIDVLKSIFEVIGYWTSPQIQLRFDGIDAMDKMNQVVDKARKFKVGEKVSDFIIDEVIDFAEGYKDLPKDNFVQLVLNEDYRVTVRPSGTEPILRIYFDIRTDIKKEGDEVLEKLQDYFKNLS